MSQVSEPPRDRRRFASWIGGLVLVAVCGVGFWLGTREQPTTEQQPPPPWFETVTGSGLDFTHRNGEEAGQFTILESLGGGIALIDYDRDGWLDVFVPGGGYYTSDLKSIRGHPCKLFRNLGGWRFRDVTSEAGLDREWWYTHGVAVADYDRDGWPDLLVTGYGRIALFRNEAHGSGRRFVDVTASVGLGSELWSTSAGWADMDGDGFPELYVCHYCNWSPDNHPPCAGQSPGVSRDVCPPERFKPQLHALFKNEGGKAFRNVSRDHGFTATGNGLGVVLLDVTDDGQPDLYVGNDATPNFLFVNRSGRLEEKGMAAGVAVDDTGKMNGSMGVDAGDFDGTGRPALWVSNFQGESHGLYRNRGNARFEHISNLTGVGSLSRNLVGFGCSFIDADNDGWEDLFLAHGHVLQFPPNASPVRQQPIFLHNEPSDAGRGFRDISATAGSFFRHPAIGRGLAVGDLDNDGWPDVVVCHTNEPVALVRNVVSRHTTGEWIGVRLIGKGSRDVVGSTVRLEVQGRVLTRFVKGGGSYLSASDPRLLFGLGEGGVPGRVTVKWAWGGTETWTGLEAGAYWELHEGDPLPRRVTMPKS